MKQLLIILAFVFCTACIGEDGPPTVERVDVGDPVPEFMLDDLVSPRDFVGQRSLIVFFVSTCPDCRRELPVIDEACRDLPDLQAIAISRGEALDPGEWPYPSLHYYADPTASIYGLFAEHTVPRVYLIDESGTIVWKAIERLPANFKQTINEILY